MYVCGKIWFLIYERLSCLRVSAQIFEAGERISCQSGIIFFFILSIAFFDVALKLVLLFCYS